MKNLIGPTRFMTILKRFLNASRRSSDLTRQLLAFARRQTVSPKVLDMNRLIVNSEKMLQRLIGEGHRIEK